MVFPCRQPRGCEITMTAGFALSDFVRSRPGDSYADAGAADAVRRGFSSTGRGCAAAGRFAAAERVLTIASVAGRWQTSRRATEGTSRPAPRSVGRAHRTSSAVSCLTQRAGRRSPGAITRSGPSFASSACPLQRAVTMGTSVRKPGSSSASANTARYPSAAVALTYSARCLPRSASPPWIATHAEHVDQCGARAVETLGMRARVQRALWQLFECGEIERRGRTLLAADAQRNRGRPGAIRVAGYRRDEQYGYDTGAQRLRRDRTRATHVSGPA